MTRDELQRAGELVDGMNAAIIDALDAARAAVVDGQAERRQLLLELIARSTKQSAARLLEDHLGCLLVLVRRTIEGSLRVVDVHAAPARKH